MTINRILVDSNICLDAALFRKSFVKNALMVFEEAELRSIDIVIASHAFDTFFYILRQDFSTDKAYQLIQELRSISKIAPVTQKTIDDAIALKWRDFEDAIHYLSAVDSECDAIITRDGSGFQSPSIPILSPFGFLDQLDN
ncbi:MAG: PIN domain-containing protein [Gracilimonas sp.]